MTFATKKLIPREQFLFDGWDAVVQALVRHVDEQMETTGYPDLGTYAHEHCLDWNELLLLEDAVRCVLRTAIAKINAPDSTVPNSVNIQIGE